MLYVLNWLMQRKHDLANSQTFCLEFRSFNQDILHDLAFTGSDQLSLETTESSQ